MLPLTRPVWTLQIPIAVSGRSGYKFKETQLTPVCSPGTANWCVPKAVQGEFVGRFCSLGLPPDLVRCYSDQGNGNVGSGLATKWLLGKSEAKAAGQLANRMEIMLRKKNSVKPVPCWKVPNSVQTCDVVSHSILAATGFLRYFLAQTIKIY
jgi:hypothetical protein